MRHPKEKKLGENNVWDSIKWEKLAKNIHPA